MANEAFRTYALDTPKIARTVYARIEKQRADLSAQLVERYAKDWSDYCGRAGVIEGLTLAMEICVAVTKEEER